MKQSSRALIPQGELDLEVRKIFFLLRVLHAVRACTQNTKYNTRSEIQHYDITLLTLLYPLTKTTLLYATLTIMLLYTLTKTTLLYATLTIMLLYTLTKTTLLYATLTICY